MHEPPSEDRLHPGARVIQPGAARRTGRRRDRRGPAEHEPWQPRTATWRPTSAVRAASDAAGRASACWSTCRARRSGWARSRQARSGWRRARSSPSPPTRCRGSQAQAGTTYAGLAGDVPRDRVLVDDGRVVLEVTAAGGRVRTRVVTGGVVSDHKGLNLPGVKVSVSRADRQGPGGPALGTRLRADMIALSFVQGPEDAAPSRRIMDEAGVRLPLIAKIEKPHAIGAWPEVVEAFDADHGRSRRSRRRIPAGAGPDGPETDRRAGQGQGQAGHRGDPDAGVDDLAPGPPGRRPPTWPTPCWTAPTR